MDRLVERALAWCEAHVNPFTQLLHYSPQGNAAVPFVENAYYALALFRSHQVDKGQKAKWLLGRIFAYQCADGSFPPYMHDFPHGGVRDEMRVPLQAIRERYGSVAGARLQEVLERLGGEVPPPVAIRGEDYQVSTGAYLGAVPQEGLEPQLTAGELLVNPEAQRPDSPATLRALLVDPPAVELAPETVAHRGGRWVWGDAQRIHTLSCEEVEGKELAFFLDLHDCDIRVNGNKATTFQLGDVISIQSGNVRVELTFELQSGEGVFMGHIAHGNRPSQVLKEGTYDWTIFVRKVSGDATLAYRWHIP